MLAGAVLLLAYLRVAGTEQVNSDAAGLVLQARDMLHGNPLLHGWWCTDVSFITTELPQYAVVTAVAGVRPEVPHICGALTYTSLVLLAAFVARGRARGPEGVFRALLAAGVILAPQPGNPALVMLGSPDHVGTAVPLLMLLLLLDRAPNPRARARWYIPAALSLCLITFVLLGWTMVGDPLIEVVGIGPLATACLLRALRITLVRGARARRGRGGLVTAADASFTSATATEMAGESPADRGTGDRSAADLSWRAAAYHLVLAGSAVAAIPLAGWLNAEITRHNGYMLGPNRYHLMPLSQMTRNASLDWQGFLMMFGADYGPGAGNVIFALAHLLGVAVVIASIAFAVWRLLASPRRARAGDLVADFLLLAVVINVAAYVAFFVPTGLYDAHELGPVAAFGAALAGRLLGGPLLRARVPWQRVARHGRGLTGRLGLVPVFGAALALYLALLGIAATTANVPPQNVLLASFLIKHNLRSGLASYWDAASASVDSNGKVTILAIGVHGGRKKGLAPDKWEDDLRLKNPATHNANYVVLGPDKIVPLPLTLKQFGQPAKTYHDGPYTIMVYGHNLLGKLNPV